MAERHWFPTDVVVVPRADFDRWSHATWPEMVAAAERGELSMRSGKDLAGADVALFRQVRADERLFARDAALVYSQGW